jgi:hypothetical protein
MWQVSSLFAFWADLLLKTMGITLQNESYKRHRQTEECCEYSMCYSFIGAQHQGKNIENQTIQSVPKRSSCEK